MKQVSTLSYLLEKNPQVKTKNRFKVKECTIKTILSYSNSVQCIKTRAVGDVLMINN